MTRFHHRIEERNIFKTSTATFDALPFDYDANGNVAAISDGATGRVGRGDRTMAYDALDRLMSAASPMFGNGTTGTVAFTHDVLDNLVNLNMPATGPTHPMPARNQFYCYDTNWRLTSLRDADGCAGSALNTLTYDVQGNVASKDGLSYDFDFGNRLREVDAGATLVESYRYDAYGRRALSFAPSGNLLSFYDQAGQLMYQRDLRQGKLLNYIYLGGSLVAIADQGLWGGAVTAKRYQHTDALGTPVAVTDENRNVIERSEYEPYGQLLNRAQHDGPGFTGHVQDALTGLTYMQQRYFDPMIGRFLSVDPVTATSIGGNFNRYWYGNDNPYKFKDPDGRLVCNTLACEEKKKKLEKRHFPVFQQAAADDEQAQEQKNLPRYISPKSLDTLEEVGKFAGKETAFYIFTDGVGKIAGRLLGPVARYIKSVRAASNLIPEGKLANHIFSGQADKLMDTPANRKLITSLTNNRRNLQGFDEYGKAWFAVTREDGTQLYAYTQNGVVKGAGVNDVPLDIIKEQNLGW